MHRKNRLYQLLRLKWMATLLIMALAVGYALGQSAPTLPPTVPHNIGLNLMIDGNVSTIRVEQDRTLLVLESPWTINGESVDTVEWATHPGRTYIHNALNDMMVPQSALDQMQIEFPPLDGGVAAADVSAADLLPMLFITASIPLLYVATRKRTKVHQIEDGMKIR